VNNIQSICGEKPNSISVIDPGNDPNFVFENDPSYDAINLFDAEGNAVSVNSWIECSHYVEGGWSNTYLPNYPGEQIATLFLFLTLTAYVTIKKFVISND